MKRFILQIAAVLALSACGSIRHAGSDDSAQNFRIGTYNVWRSDIGKGDYAWEVRKDRLAQSIVDIDFDVFGIQEVDYTIQKELPLLLSKHKSPDYAWYMFSPYSQDGIGDKAQAILYKKDRYELVESHNFWLSETPEIKSYGWDEQEYCRGGFCIVLQDKKSGKKIFVMHSHFPLGKEAKKRAADVIIAMEKKFNKEGLPAFFLGDLNNRPNTPGSQILRTHWTDSYLYLPQESREGSQATFNGHDVNRNMNTTQRIDYVYFRNGATPLKYHCSNKKYDGFWPSDHCAVYVDMKIHK